MSVSAAVSTSEGGERSDSAKRAMLPTVRAVLWWYAYLVASDQIYGGMRGWARKRTMYAIMSSHRARVHPREG